MSLDWFPKKKERYCKKGDMFVGSLGLREQEGIYNAGRNDAIDECESALMKMLDKEKIANMIYAFRQGNEHMEDIDFEDCRDVAQAFIDYIKGGV